MTVVMDPRVSEKDFYDQLTRYHVNVVCSTGSAWKVFFEKLESEINRGKKFDFSALQG